MDEREEMASSKAMVMSPLNLHKPFNPMWSLSPLHNNGRSTLYDSYELEAVTRQLNKAIIQASSARLVSSPLLGLYLRQNASCSRPTSIMRSKRESLTGESRTTGASFASRLWKKIKQGIFKNQNGSHI
ncbi:hypothetical protein QQ045_022406 [Rhodiola kirilowii]